MSENYTPPEYCNFCGTHHEPEYPHVMSAQYKRNFYQVHGHIPTIENTYSHCKGIIFQAVEAAYQDVCHG